MNIQLASKYISFIYTNLCHDFIQGIPLCFLLNTLDKTRCVTEDGSHRSLAALQCCAAYSISKIFYISNRFFFFFCHSIFQNGHPYADHIFKCIWKLLNFEWYFIEICSLGSNWQYIIGSDNDLAPNRQQVFIWTNDCLVYWCIYVPLSLNELTGNRAII